jgi:hypothetical protein
MALGLAVEVGVADGMARLPLPSGDTDPLAPGVGAATQPMSTATTRTDAASARMGRIAITACTPPVRIAFPVNSVSGRRDHHIFANDARCAEGRLFGSPRVR